MFKSYDELRILEIPFSSIEMFKMTLRSMIFDKVSEVKVKSRSSYCVASLLYYLEVSIIIL